MCNTFTFSSLAVSTPSRSHARIYVDELNTCNGTRPQGLFWGVPFSQGVSQSIIKYMTRTQTDTISVLADSLPSLCYRGFFENNRIGAEALFQIVVECVSTSLLSHTFYILTVLNEQSKNYLEKHMQCRYIRTCTKSNSILRVC